jgi:hypothetical protein
MDIMPIAKGSNAIGNSGIIDGFGMHVEFSTGLPLKFPLLENDPPHIFFIMPELVITLRMVWVMVA